MKTPSERIMTVVHDENLKSVTQLAKVINYNQSTISKIVNGKLKNINRNLADAIVKRYPKYSTAWLLTGEGEMLLTKDGEQLFTSDGKRLVAIEAIPLQPATLEEFTTTKAGSKFYKRSGDGKLLMEVNVVPIAALGSPEDEFATINMGEWEKTLFEVDEVHHGLYYAFKVEGDSMDDGSRKSFAAGDMVLVRELPRDEWAPKLRINDWPYWVVVFDNNIRLKQIVAQDTEAGTITLHSLNPSPEFCDFTIPLSRITRLFNVVKHKPQMIQYK